MAIPGGPVPTLSQVRDWDTEHLVTAAGHWTKTATVWEDSFTHLAANISSPGGVPWEGEAAEAAQQRAHSDKMTVIGLADQLHSASTIATAGAREIDEARRSVVRLVDAAEEDGFTVGEDFSVSDPNYYDRLTAAARQARAEAIATKLHAAVGTLMSVDNKVARELTTATSGLGGNVFPRTGGDGDQGAASDAKDQVKYVVGGAPEAPPVTEPPPLQDPSETRWDGPPPAGASDQTGYWALDMSRPAKSPDPLAAPAPYSSAPPPCSILEGPSTGALTVFGQTPQYYDGYGFDLQNQYRFRISGSEFYGQTQMVKIGDSWYQAQWHRYTYEMNKIPIIGGSDKIPSVQLPIMSEAKDWTPVTMAQIMRENTMYPGKTFIVPNAFGDSIKVLNGEPQLKNPVVPIIVRGD